MPVPRTKRHFQLVLIRPSQYDDRGRVVQTSRSSVPANSLACLYALALDAAERQVLGSNIAIDITAVDESNTRVLTKDIIAQFARHDGYGMVGLVGVQSSQFPRSLDIARQLRRAGLPVVIGGSPVSGRLTVRPDMQTDLRQALDMGCSLFAGDPENGRLDQLIRDAANGALKSIYRHVDALPALESAPSPFLPPEGLKRMIDHYAGFDPGRGCPFQCSFCTTIDEQLQKARRSWADGVEQSIRTHHKEGVPWFFITDDDFARNQDWEAVFDRIILLREREKIALQIAIQIDVSCHKIANFVVKARRAGVRMVFVGLADISSARNEYRSVIRAWNEVNVTPYAGYILQSSRETSPGLGKSRKELLADIPESFCYAATSSRIRSATPIRNREWRGSAISESKPRRGVTAD